MMLVANEPVGVLQISVQDGTVSRPKKLYATAKPMRPAMLWLKEADAIEAGIRGGSVEGFDALAEFVASYNPEWPKEAILEQCSGPQFMEAFYALKDMNDPLAVTRRREQAEQERGLRALEALGKTKPDELNRLVEKHSSNALSKT